MLSVLAQLTILLKGIIHRMGRLSSQERYGTPTAGFCVRIASLSGLAEHERLVVMGLY